jgi:pimeloyl-ACP methyl ester carboxylesterase
MASDTISAAGKPCLGEFAYGQEGRKLYYLEGGAGYPVLLLHGWGCSSETMQPVFNHLAADFHVYNFDLPGFGMSPEPPSAWDTNDYAALLENFIHEKCGKPPILIAHSFGGRLSLRLAAKGIPHKMILTGCAGLKAHRGPDYYAKVYTYKAAKGFLSLPGLSGKKEELLNKARSKSGSTDYRQASEVMRAVFVKTVNEDQTANLPKITAPTILFWGEKDTATPLVDGQLMEKKMRDAALIVKNGGTHYAFLEFLPEFLAITDSFLKSEKGFGNI